MLRQDKIHVSIYKELRELVETGTGRQSVSSNMPRHKPFGYDGATYLSSIFLFRARSSSSLSLLSTAASQSVLLSLWDYTTKISLCLTNGCHDNGTGAVCKREHEIVIVCLIAISEPCENACMCACVVQELRDLLVSLLICSSGFCV